MLGSGSSSAFTSPSRNTITKGLWYVLPPAVPISALVTGGLGRLYSSINSSSPSVDDDEENQQEQDEKGKEKRGHQHFKQRQHEGGGDGAVAFKDKNGAFCPRVGLPLMAGRYQFVEIVARGQSAVIIKAKDICRDNALVAIKVLHEDNFLIGGQEADILREINSADPENFAHVVRLQNIFQFEGHYCLVLDYLQETVKQFWSRWSYTEKQKLDSIREAAAKLLNILGFLGQQNIIHADLKPDNILLTTRANYNCLDLRVVDFGNSIRNVPEEVTLYCEDYEMQTLVYRAPEVLFGVSIGPEVDMWSVGCILAELYLDEPLFLGHSKDAILAKIVSLLGSPPKEFQENGKFSEEFSPLFQGTPLPFIEIVTKLQSHFQCADFSFINFLGRLLAYKPEERYTPWEAMQSNFLAPYFPLRFTMPAQISNGRIGYSSVLLSKEDYNLTQKPNPKICKSETPKICKDNKFRSTSSIAQKAAIKLKNKKSIVKTKKRKILRKKPINQKTGWFNDR